MNQFAANALKVGVVSPDGKHVWDVVIDE